MPLLLPLRCIIFFLFFVVVTPALNRNLEETSSWWSVVASGVNILTILLLVFIAKAKGVNYFKLINYQKGATKPKQIIIILLKGGLVETVTSLNSSILVSANNSLPAIFIDL